MTRRAPFLGLGLALPALAYGANAPAVGSLANSAGSMFQVMFGLVAVVLLILGLSWVSRRLGIAQTLGASPLKIVGSVSLGGRERAVLIEVNDTWIVAGVATGQVSALATLPKGTVASTQTTLPGSGFASRFKSVIEKSGNAK
jgi:flagellar protein FliO/FliZ